MKRTLRTCFAVALLASAATMFADPIFPFSAPIASQLSNDVATLESIPDRTAEQNRELSRDNAALRAYRRDATKWSSDVSILKNLYELLAGSSAYSPLIQQATSDYRGEFGVLEAELRRMVDTSPRSGIRSNAYKQLNLASNALVKADAAPNTRASITQLGTAAHRLDVASNLASRAASSKVRNSSAFAKIGKLNFVSRAGSSFGTNQEGVLDFVATDNGLIRREIAFHIEGVTSDTPATYELGVGANTAIYTVTDPLRKNHGTNTVVQFSAVPSSETHRSVLIIDGIQTNYLVGRFTFLGFTTNELNAADTNRFTTITNGEFQLTYTNPPPPVLTDRVWTPSR